MNLHESSRKPFVEPSLKEEASLEDVTLISGGHGHHGPTGKPGKPGGGPHSNNHAPPQSGGHGHGHGRGT